MHAGLASALPWVGVTLLVLIAGVFWLEWSGRREAPIAMPPAVRPPAAIVAASVAPSQTASTPAVTAAPVGNNVARIELETTAPGDDQGSGGLAAALAAPSKPSPSASAKLAEASSAIAPTAPVPVVAAADPALPTIARPPNRSAAKPANAPKARPSGAPTAAASKAQRSPFAAMESPRASGKANNTHANRDIDLLAALLSSGNVVAAGAPVARPRLSTKLSSLEASPSTRERLSLCEQLQGQEISACKARACSGKWGRDAACPAGSAPPTRKKSG